MPGEPFSRQANLPDLLFDGASIGARWSGLQLFRDTSRSSAVLPHVRPVARASGERIGERACPAPGPEIRSLPGRNGRRAPERKGRPFNAGGRPFYRRRRRAPPVDTQASAHARDSTEEPRGGERTTGLHSVPTSGTNSSGVLPSVDPVASSWSRFASWKRRTTSPHFGQFRCDADGTAISSPLIGTRSPLSVEIRALGSLLRFRLVARVGETNGGAVIQARRPLWRLRRRRTVPEKDPAPRNRFLPPVIGTGISCAGNIS